MRNFGAWVCKWSQISNRFLARYQIFLYNMVVLGLGRVSNGDCKAGTGWDRVRGTGDWYCRAARPGDWYNDRGTGVLSLVLLVLMLMLLMVIWLGFQVSIRRSASWLYIH